MTSRPDIAFFLPNLAGGGAEKATVRLAQAIQALGPRVELVVGTAKGPIAQEAADSLTVVDLDVGRLLGSIPRLSAYLRRSSPKVLVSVMYDTTVFAAFAVALSRRSPRFVSVIHTTVERHYSEAVERSPSNRIKAILVNWLGKAIYRYQVAKVIAVSQGVAKSFVRYTGVSPESVVTIHNSVVSAELLDNAKRGVRGELFPDPALPQFVAVGRLAKAKGFDVLLTAFAEVVRQIPARLTILGEGPQREELEALAETLGIAALVDLPGYSENPLPYVSCADTFVLSSRREGLPTALIEAVALGTRVVATDCRTGPREILAGRPGMLVPVDDPKALADAMIASLRSEKPAQPDPAAFFSVEQAARRYIEICLGD
jgi:glycosyltransferase involved in cell wall biosynthesis